MKKEDKIEGTPSGKRGMKRLTDYLFRFGLPLLLTVGLVWYMFSKVDFAEMLRLLSHGVDYWWILLAMGISVFSHIFRAARWRIQLRTLGIDPPFIALCCSVFGCYALNLLFPRLGEVWRCTYISRREKGSFTSVLGSMVADRMCDTLMVLALLILTFLTAAPAIEAFMDKYAIGRDMLRLISNIWTWVAGALALTGIWLLFRFGREIKIVKRVRSWMEGMWKGFSALWKMEGKWRFLLLTFAIWGCYFVQLYVAFFAFGFTRELCTEPGLGFGLEPCLVAFVLSSIGMAIPSNGGLGPWNIAVMFGLAVYGITEAEGTAFSMLVWSAQTVMLIILGMFTMGYVSRGKNELKK